MSKYIIGTIAQCATWKLSIDTDAGVPARGVVYGGPDRTSQTPGPGWTITVTPDVVTVDSATAVLEVPDDRIVHLGRRGVPTLAEAKNEVDLPIPLRDKVRDSKGLLPDGTPKPLKLDSSSQKEGKALVGAVSAATRAIFAPSAPEPAPEAPTAAPKLPDLRPDPPEPQPAQAVQEPTPVAPANPDDDFIKAIAFPMAVFAVTVATTATMLLSVESPKLEAIDASVDAGAADAGPDGGVREASTD